jgi:hypothetical protein
MKNSFVVFFVFVSFLANAQFVRGNKFIAGTFSISTQHASTNNSGTPVTNGHMFELSPAFGYFLNDKYAVGGGIGFISTSQKTTYDPNQSFEYESQAITFRAFAKRYFLISDNFYFMMTGSVDFSRGKQGQNPDKTKYYSLGLSFKPAFIFFPSPKWGIEGGIGNLGFSHTRNLSEEEKYNNFYLNYGTLYLGFAYYILN